MTHVPCGYAVIINNFEFDAKTKMELRIGSDQDVVRMTDLFEWLQFTVDIHQNCTADQIMSIVRKYVVDEDHTNYDCFVLFLMSHGFPNGIFGIEGKPVYFQHIREQFTAGNCYSLANKPKLFFVQACRGQNADMGYELTDSPHYEGKQPSTHELSSIQHNKPYPTQSSYPTQYTPDNLDQSYENPSPPPPISKHIPEHSDMVTMYASTENRAALRNTKTGGWFVTQLDNVLREYASSEDLLSMITKVANRVSLKKSEENGYMQCPAHGANLRKKLFFNPKRP